MEYIYITNALYSNKNAYCLVQEPDSDELGVHTILNKLNIANTPFIKNGTLPESNRLMKWLNIIIPYYIIHNME